MEIEKPRKVSYCFITKKLKNGTLKVAFCPATNMLGDCFTKPLQGIIQTRNTILFLPNTKNWLFAHESV